jgi:hypothetical protein
VRETENIGRVAGPDRASYRPVRAIGLFLLLEVLGLAGLGVYELGRFDWRTLKPEVPEGPLLETLGVLMFVPPAAMTLLAAFGFLFLQRRGWLLAAIAQGLNLGVCLWLYYQVAPYYAYPIMAYCVLMVLYLNSNDVRLVFHPRRDADGQGA